MFLVTFLLMNTAESRKQLDNNIFQAGSIAQKHNCRLVPLDLQPEEGLMSCLPLGLNQVEIQRGLTSSSTAILVPFYHAGAVPDQPGGPVLRHQRPVQQPYHGG